MKSGIQFKQGELVVVPFPFSDLTTIRQRPVLIISNNRYNDTSEDIITCGITSNLKNSQYSILFDNPDLLEGSLPVKSRIKVDKLFTLNKNIIIKRIGRINKETFDKVKNEFFNLV